jgi:hypothetical protein
LSGSGALADRAWRGAIREHASDTRCQVDSPTVERVREVRFKACGTWRPGGWPERQAALDCGDERRGRILTKQREGRRSAAVYRGDEVERTRRGKRVAAGEEEVENDPQREQVGFWRRVRAV